jgi:hypothetical protein
MADAKTAPTGQGVADFIGAVEPDAKRADATVLDALFGRVTGEPARMWGPTIVGYGEYRTTYASGREVYNLRCGFSPRKPRHSLYLMWCGDERDETAFAPLLERLGKHSRGKACLYVNKLADIDMGVLEEMVALSWKNSFERYLG